MEHETGPTVKLASLEILESGEPVDYDGGSRGEP